MVRRLYRWHVNKHEIQSPQITSVQNCFTMPAINGPRQITGWFISQQVKRHYAHAGFTGNRIQPNLITFGMRMQPKAIGMDGPVYRRPEWRFDSQRAAS